MKLYAKTKSERATKGQGGEWLDIEVLNERKETVAKFEVRNSEYPHTDIDILYWVHTPTVSFGEMDYGGKQKGEKQKGELRKCKYCGAGSLDYTNPTNPFCHACKQSQE